MGDQIFCNAYLTGTAAFGFAGLGQQAVVAAGFMGVEAVHRALRASRAASAATTACSSGPATARRRRTPDDPDVNTRFPDQIRA